MFHHPNRSAKAVNPRSMAHPRMHPRLQAPLLPGIALLCLFVLLFPALLQAATSPPELSASSKLPPPTTQNQEKLRQMTLFSSSMVKEETMVQPDNRSMQQIMRELAEVEKQYVDLLDEGSSATGLYATGEYDNDYRNGEDKYYGQLELRLFNDGYFEERRKEEKKILQTRLELLQVNRDMDDRALEDELYSLYTMENLLHALHSHARMQVLTKIMPKRSAARKSGYTTATDILELRHALETARREYEFYSGRKRNKLSPELAAVLNSIESAQLKDSGTLEEISKKNSKTMAIQDIFQQRAKQFPAWSDNLAVDLFAGRRKEFFETERNYVGIKLEIPLYWDDRKDDLIDLQQRIYRFQKEGVAKRIHQNLDKLSAYFSFYQQKIRSSIDTLSLLTAKQEAAKTEINNPVQRDGDDPGRMLHTLELKIIDTRFEALQYRLKEYELILKLMALTGIKDIRELFLSAQPGSADHSAAPIKRHPGHG